MSEQEFITPEQATRLQPDDRIDLHMSEDTMPLTVVNALSDVHEALASIATEHSGLAQAPEKAPTPEAAARIWMGEVGCHIQAHRREKLSQSDLDLAA